MNTYGGVEVYEFYTCFTLCTRNQLRSVGSFTLQLLYLCRENALATLAHDKVEQHEL